LEPVGRVRPHRRITYREGPKPERIMIDAKHRTVASLMQAGCDPWQAAGWPGMPETLLRVYGHHH
jgi:hypothetical protein